MFMLCNSRGDYKSEVLTQVLYTYNNWSKILKVKLYT